MENLTLEPQTLETIDTVTIPFEDYDNAAEHRTHIVNPPDNPHLWTVYSMTAQDIVDIARTAGAKIKALCGYEFVPKANPEKYDACQACMDIAGELMRAKGE